VHDNILFEIEFLSSVLDGTTGNGAFFVSSALLIAAEYLQRLYPVEVWQERAQEKLLGIVESEVQSDRIEVEQVPMYHGQVVLTLLDYFVVLRANGQPINGKLKRVTQEMLAALVRLSDPEDRIPPIGDSDRFAIDYICGFYGAVLEGDRAAGEGVKMAAKDSEQPCEGEPKLTLFKESGWAVVRWLYGTGHQGYLLFDCSGKPEPPNGSHSHADDLQFLLHSTSGPVLTDPGRFTYCHKFEGYYPFTRRRIYPDGKLRYVYKRLFPRFADLRGRNWRRYFQSTLAHNTVALNGQNQAHYEERDQPGRDVILKRATTLGPLVMVEGELAGVGRSGKAPLPGDSAIHEHGHRRVLFGYLPHLWVVVDYLTSLQHGDWITSYHLGERARVTRGTRPVQFRIGDETHCIGFAAAGSHDVEVRVEDDWVSQLYNMKRPSKTIRATVRRATDVSLVTVLGSSVGGRADMKGHDGVSGERDQCGAAKDLCHFDLIAGDVEIRLFVNPSGGQFVWNGYESNASFSFVSTTGGRSTAAGFMDGNYLRIGDRIVESSSSNCCAYEKL